MRHNARVRRQLRTQELYGILSACRRRDDNIALQQQGSQERPLKCVGSGRMRDQQQTDRRTTAVAKVKQKRGAGDGNEIGTKEIVVPRGRTKRPENGFVMRANRPVLKDEVQPLSQVDCFQ